ncbi:MAG: HAD hydrolase-like protein [Lachnospiraceae bacterium]|nr:HAD hydrolase-like protein [Lachnospiraceae bacterium]
MRMGKKVAMVPIKLNNERVPNKNTKILGDKPLLQYILHTLLKVEGLDAVYVFCSDEKIIPYLPEGVRFLKRDASLDLPTANFTQFFEAFMNLVDADTYVFTHATAPFIEKETIELCISKVEGGEYDSAFTAVKIQDFLWKDNRPLNFDAQNLPRSQDLAPIYRETSGVYVFRREVFQKGRRRIGEKPYIAEVSWREAVDINTYEDFEIARMVVGERSRSPLNLIFDFDGVVIDSEKVQEHAFYESYREVVGDGNCPEFAEYMKHTGDSLPNIFRKMGLPEEMAGPYRRISREAIDKVIVLDEVVALIRRMREKGVRCAICTGKDRVRTIEILEHYRIAELFDAVVCSDDVDHPKPSPEPTLLAMERIGAIRENTILIGDGYNDILSAKAAGACSVLVSWCGNYCPEAAGEADYDAGSVSELKEILVSRLADN